jgi:Predicted Zn-dependent proteases and their inactivated homologs
MKDLALRALDTAKKLGATYADVRILLTRREDILVKNERVASLEQTEDIGVGVRVIADGAWGFAATREVTPEALDKCVAQAVEIAKASATLKEREVVLAPEPAHVAFWETPIEVDPFAISLDKKVETLRQCTQIMRKFPEVKVAVGWMSFQRKHQWFASTEGAIIEQILTRSGAGIQAQATDGSDLQVRSYPQSHGGQFMSKGYELVENFAWLTTQSRLPRKRKHS